jgi:hypothetical protein
MYRGLSWGLGCVIGALGVSIAHGAESALRPDLWKGIKDAVIAADPQAKEKRCLAADMGQPAGRVFEAATPPLSPGIYQAVLRLKLSTNNTINTAPLKWSLAVGGAGAGKRDFDILVIERPGVYQEIPCRFTVTRQGVATVSLAWKRESFKKDGAGVRLRVEKSELPTVAGMAGLDDKEAGGAGALDVLGDPLESEPVSSLRFLWMAVDQVAIEPLGDVAIARLEADKIRYKPGEKARIDVVLKNVGTTPHTLAVETCFVHELDDAIPVDQRTVTLAGGAEQAFTCEGPAFEKKWGYAVRCRVTENGRLLAETSEPFTVHDNLWAVLIAGRGPAQFTAHVNATNAAASARATKRRHQNFVESGFWAPDEFGDFTPDTETWWGGQGCYYGSVSGTRLMIAEGHKAGIAYAVYANIWGGDGPPAFEQVRAHPDWGHASTFNVEWLERWDRNPMGTGKPGVPMHVWPLTIIDYGNPEPFRHHGRELIGTHKQFGWDAVRYDSHAISPGNVRVVDIVKQVVHAELPEFQFGYNSSVPNGDAKLAEPFRAMCANGGGIMEEGIRQYGGGGMSFSGGKTYAEFAGRLLDFKEEARRAGGHFMAIGMDECFPNDLVYQHILWLAGNTHPCYDWADVSVADYMGFATRHAGLLWDPAVTTVTNARAWLDLGPAAAFLWLPDRFLHQRDLGGGRRQVILHLVNAPLETVLCTNDDNKVPPLREKVALSLKLPGAAKLASAWLLSAEPDVTQVRLPAEVKDGRVSFTVPRLRFWSVVVVELEQAEAYP